MEEMSAIIKRINELYKKSKESGLTDAEREEQQYLRRKYIESIRGNLRSQLNSITIVEEDGSLTNLGEKYGNKSREKVVVSSVDVREVRLRSPEAQTDHLSKKALRQNILQARDTMLASERDKYSDSIQNMIMQLPEYKSSDTIFAYSAFGSEVSCERIIKHALADGKKVYLPRVEDDFNMSFYEIDSSAKLVRSGYGILEPSMDLPRYNPMSNNGNIKNALMLMPGVVFDRHGHRIGYGKGYYDRFLFCHREICEGGPLPLYLIGLCFDNQLLDKIPSGMNDFKIDGVMTQSGLIGFE